MHMAALSWLEAIRADVVFGWRRLMRTRTTSCAAVLSLALAIGACTSAFRLIDAVLLRPLPIAGADRLYALSRQGVGPDGKPSSFDGWPHPAFRLMRAAVRSEAELIAVSYAERADVSHQPGRDIERPYVQYVSGWMFGTFGLRAAAGRLLSETDDDQPHAHPYAVLSYDYWTRRFGRDPAVVGRIFTLGSDVLEIVGVAEATFTGTETGTVTDIFVPATMSPRVERSDTTWIRVFARLNDGAGVGPLRARLHAISRAFEEERAKGFTGMSRASIDRYLDQTLMLEPAAAGASGLQKDYGRSLVALGALIALVLLIASANVANLMTVQASARMRELALRVSIGAGRGRLVQLLLVEAAILALAAAALGTLFTWWATPFVVSHINPPDNPVRLSLPIDWRVFGFSVTLTVVVTMLFGLTPALRASAVSQASALKSGADARSRRRVMHGVIAAQTAFCFLVVFAGGLFVASFERLSRRPLGFDAERLLVLDAVPASPQSSVVWEEVADHLRSIAGVESVALAGWPLLSRTSWNGFVSIEGAPPGPTLAYFLSVSPGWLATMKVPLIDGRDFQPHETAPGVAIVNQTFVRQFFGGAHPIGRTFAKGPDRYRIVGVAGDVPYRSVREAILPAAYVPFRGTGRALTARAAFIVRTAGPPLAQAAALRQGVPRARHEFRVTNVRTQTEITAAHTVRDRFLAMLALFFTTVAVVLAGIGLYGVLEYSVLELRRDIGIRLALGARPGHVARRVALHTVSMVAVGGLVGVALSLGLARHVQTLLFEVGASDATMLTLPAVAVIVTTLLASALPVIRAARTNPAVALRAD